MPALSNNATTGIMLLVALRGLKARTRDRVPCCKYTNGCKNGQIWWLIESQTVNEIPLERHPAAQEHGDARQLRDVQFIRANYSRSRLRRSKAFYSVLLSGELSGVLGEEIERKATEILDELFVHQHDNIE